MLEEGEENAYNLSIDELKKVNKQLLVLILKGKGINGVDEIDHDTGDTPFHSAVKYLHKDLEIFMILQRAQVEINCANNDGKTPLNLLDEMLS